ncbi:MAG: ABC transporter substrate-binding protein [Actinomycetota bacterium]
MTPAHLRRAPVGEIKRTVIVGLVALAAFWAGGCGIGQREEPGPAAGASRRPSGEIAVAYPEEPPSLNPYLYPGATNATRDLLRPVLPTLLTIDSSLRYRPGLATRVPSGADLEGDPFSVTFHLDPGARWSDGAPITSADVYFTWKTILHPAWRVADRSPYRRLARIDTPDPHTVRLVFHAAYPGWRDLFSGGAFILPEHLLGDQDFNRAWGSGVPVSGGPFLMESWTPGLEVVYAANPKWWGRPPGLARVRALIVPDIETAIQLLQAGRVQAVVATTQINLLARMERLEGVRARARFGTAWWELAFHHGRPGPSDAAFRKAVALGFDRPGMVEALIRGEGRPLEHLWPGRRLRPAFSGYRPDPARARRLLAAAGYVEGPNGALTRAGMGKVGLSAPAESELVGVLQRTLQTGLRRVEIEIDIRNRESDLFYGESRSEGDFDLALWERRGTPSMSLGASFHSGLEPPEGINYSRMASPEVDAALEAAERSVHFRGALLERAMEELAEALPALPLFEERSYVGFQSSLRGPDPNATVEGPFWNLEEWELHR